MKRACLVVVMVAALGCKATASSSSSDCSEWAVLKGKQAPDGGSCAAFIGESAEVNPTFDWWGASFDKKTPTKGTKLRIEAKFSRPLEDGDRPVDLHFRGGYFGVAQDKYYFWEGDSAPTEAAPPNAHWTSWQPTKVDVKQESTIAVRQDGVNIEGFINGALVGTFKLNTPPTPGPVGIGFKSAKGKAAKVKIRDFVVSE